MLLFFYYYFIYIYIFFLVYDQLLHKWHCNSLIINKYLNISNSVINPKKGKPIKRHQKMYLLKVSNLKENYLFSILLGLKQYNLMLYL